MAIDYWALSAASNRGTPQATTDIVSNTDRRDVSNVLDLLATTDTPFVNAIGWGPESGATSIEWITEDLGPGYIKAVSVVGSTGVSILIASVENLTSTEALKQIDEGTVMYHYSSTDGAHNLIGVLSVTTATGTITFEVLCCVGALTDKTSIATADKIWILGAAAGTGSLPRQGRPRDRAICSNSMMILRQDVQITGSMKSTDMYAIGREDQHQILLRLKEMQRDRERFTLYGDGHTRSTTAAGLMKGAFGFLGGQSGSQVDTSTTTLTESAVNAVVGACWENGSDNLTFFGHKDQCAKFTQWDKNRIRMAPREGRGGGYITKYMTEVGVEIDIQPMKKVPKNMVFVIDPSKCQLRAKKGRKAILEKLGKNGDVEDWQIISEFSMEMRGYGQGMHGIFTKLS
jgi:hypothetical protein